jgi:Type IV secretion-system coupling protein DNA-binding domain
MLTALTHGVLGLLTAYLCTLAGLVVGLAMSRAEPSRYLRAIWLAALAALIGLIVWSLIARSVSATLGSAFASLLGLIFLAVCGGVAGRFRIGQMKLPRHQRGARVESSVSRIRGAPLHSVTLAQVPVPFPDETKHFKIIGTTGTGKSTAIREVLRGAINRGDRAVIADPDGSYLGAFYDQARGDQILNPFDARSCRWDLFRELSEPYDAEQLARSLIPDYEGPDRNWRNYSRVFLSSLIRQLGYVHVTDWETLYRMIAYAPVAELKDLLSETPAGPYLAEDNGKFFQSVRSIAVTQLSVFEHLARQRSGAGLSVKQWIREEGGVLFLPYKAGEIAALRNLISAWMRLAIFETMNGAEADRRIWFAVDELDALGPIDGLPDALARLRKFGGRCLLGLQAYAQATSTYGQGPAQAMMENCGTSLILRVSASDQGGTAAFASRLIGDREVVRHQKSVSRQRGLTRFRPTHTESEQIAIEPAVLAAELEQLPDLHGYLKFASDPVWRRVQLG